MKKRILYALLTFVVCSTMLSAQAIQQPKSSDYEIIPEENTEIQAPVENESNQTIIQSSQVVEQEETTNNSSVKNSPYDTITPMGHYFKIQKDGKFGVIDANGNIILAPVFQRISTIMVEGKECFAAKIDGKYRVYYNTGNLISEDNLYPVEQNTSILAEKANAPQFHAVVEKKEIVYSPAKTQTNDETSNFIYEIKEIPIIKISNKNTNITTQTTTTDIINSTLDNKKDLFTINKKQFYILKKDGHIGITNADGKVIIPPVFDSFSVKTPGNIFKDPVFIVSSNNVYSIFDTEGNLLAEEVYEKINAYRNGNLYTYIEKDNKGYLRENNKLIGYLTKEGNDYKYTSKRFTFFKPHIVTNLIITILNIKN